MKFLPKILNRCSLLFYSAVITSAQSRNLAGRCLHGYEAHCYMNSIHVCLNIDHAMACE